ncbi:MAG: hypothetical protein WC092_08515, partial [Anaerovoracaceae bacterium]
MVQAMESPATMAKISAGGVGRFVGSTARYLGTDPLGATAEIGSGIVAGAYGPRAIGTVASPRGFTFGSRTFNPTGRILNSRPGQWMELQYQKARVLPEDRPVVETAYQRRQDVMNLEHANKNTHLDLSRVGVDKPFADIIVEAVKGTDDTVLGGRFAEMTRDVPVGSHSVTPKEIYVKDPVKFIENLHHEADTQGMRYARQSILDENNKPTVVKPVGRDGEPIAIRDDAPEITVLDYGVEPGTEYLVRHRANPLAEQTTDIYVRKAGVDEHGNLDLGYGLFNKYQSTPIQVAVPLRNYVRRIGNKQRVRDGKKPKPMISVQKTSPTPFTDPFVEMDGVKVQNIVDLIGRTEPERAILLARENKASKIRNDGRFGERLVAERAANKVRRMIDEYHDRDVEAFYKFGSSVDPSAETVVLPFRQWLGARKVDAARTAANVQPSTIPDSPPPASSLMTRFTEARTRPVSELPGYFNDLWGQARRYHDSIREPTPYRETPRYKTYRGYTDEAIYTTVKNRLNVADDIIRQSSQGKTETAGKLNALADVEGEFTTSLREMQTTDHYLTQQRQIGDLEWMNLMLNKRTGPIEKFNMELTRNPDHVPTDPVYDLSGTPLTDGAMIRPALDAIRGRVRANEARINELKAGKGNEAYAADQQNTRLIRESLDEIDTARQQIVNEQQAERTRATHDLDRATRVGDSARELFDRHHGEQEQARVIDQNINDLTGRLKTINTVLGPIERQPVTRRLFSRPESAGEIRTVDGRVVENPSYLNLVIARRKIQNAIAANKQEFGTLRSSDRFTNRMHQQHERDAAPPVPTEAYQGQYRDLAVPSNVQRTLEMIQRRNQRPPDNKQPIDVSEQRSSDPFGHKSDTPDRYSLSRADDDPGWVPSEQRDILDSSGESVEDTIRKLNDINEDDIRTELGERTSFDDKSMQAALPGGGGIRESVSSAPSRGMLAQPMTMGWRSSFDGGLSVNPHVQQIVKFGAGMSDDTGGDVVVRSVYDPWASTDISREMPTDQKMPSFREMSGDVGVKSPSGT